MMDDQRFTMTDLPENAVFRIDIGIDYSLLNDDEIGIINDLVDLADLQLNAPVNNRLARVAELTRALTRLGHDHTARRDEIEQEIRELHDAMANDKRNGRYCDYGILKRRVAQGAAIYEVYPMLPPLYAEAYNLYRRFSARNQNGDRHDYTTLLEEAPKWLNILKSFSDSIRALMGNV